MHEFAEREIRPVAHRYDEDEEFPWEVVRKAAGAGPYSVDFVRQTFADPSGLLPALVAEELCWGCAGSATSVEEVVQRARTSKSAFYQLFSSKEDCLGQLLARQGGGVLQAVTASAGEREGHRERSGGGSPRS